MRQLAGVQAKAPGSALQLIAGEFNAEFGRAADGHWEDVLVLGTHGYRRRSEAGKAWLECCRNEGWFDAASQFTPCARGTWWYERFNSEHVLNHVLMRTGDRWHSGACIAL